MNAMKYCKHCGEQIDADCIVCPKCGKQVEQLSASYNNNYYPNYGTAAPPTPAQYYTAQPAPKPKASNLGIASLVLSIIGCTYIIGAILAIIDVCKKDGHKKTPAYVAIAISIFWLLISVLGMSSTTDSTDTVSNNNAVASSSEETKTLEEASSEVVIPVETKEEFIASCQPADYKTLARYPDENIGQRIVLTVKVSQILQGGLFNSNEYYRVYTDTSGSGYYFGDEYFMYDCRIDDDTKILKDDIITIYCEFAGMQSVKRALTGTNEEIPAVKTYYIDILE